MTKLIPQTKILIIGSIFMGSFNFAYLLGEATVIWLFYFNVLFLNIDIITLFPSYVKINEL